MLLLLCRQTNTIPTRQLGGSLLHYHRVQVNKHLAQASQAQLESATKQGALHHLGLANSDLAGGHRLGRPRQTNMPSVSAAHTAQSASWHNTHTKACPGILWCGVQLAHLLYARQTIGPTAALPTALHVVLSGCGGPTRVAVDLPPHTHSSWQRSRPARHCDGRERHERRPLLSRPRCF